MEMFTIGIIGIVIAIILLSMGVHIALALGAVGFFGTMAIIGFKPTAWQATALIYNYVADQSFIVIPLFVFMGLLAGAGGLSKEVYSVLRMWIGGLRGGLGIATIFSCTAFGVCTGSSLVTAAVFSKVSAPEMRQHGYNKQIAYGICASGGSIGMLIPPSILLVIYGIISQESVGRLLIAGISPGILLAVFFSIGIYTLTYLKPGWFGTDVAQRYGWREKILSLRLIWPIILVAVVVIGGIFLGFFSPTEASAFGAATLLIVTLVFTKGNDRWPMMRTCIFESITINAMVFFILFGAGLFARFLMFSGITPKILELVTNAGFSNFTFVIVMALIYLVMGCFMDSISMLSITLPILTPVIKEMGIDPIWFAMITVTAIECGLITPPVGLNVYATHGAGEHDVSLEDVFRGSAPFFVMMLVTLVVIIAFPVLSTILPDIMIGKQ